jgi:hypothetical protein
LLTNPLLVNIVFYRLAEYLESEPERHAAKAEAQRAKLEALERKLGIEPSSSKSPQVGSGEPSRSGATDAPKRRFDDTDYIEQSRELTENVKSAVSAGASFAIRSPINKANIFFTALLKKKKAKLSHPTDDTPVNSTVKTTTPFAVNSNIGLSNRVAEPVVASEALSAVGA